MKSAWLGVPVKQQFLGNLALCSTQKLLFCFQVGGLGSVNTLSWVTKNKRDS
jgi:hypothetical protein